MANNLFLRETDPSYATETGTAIKGTSNEKIRGGTPRSVPLPVSVAQRWIHFFQSVTDSGTKNVIRRCIHHMGTERLVPIDFWAADGNANVPSLFANHQSMQIGLNANTL